jgi:hypothetical protein
MRAMRAPQLEGPRDIALVAFDDFDWAGLFRPRLTAIAQPIYEIGHRTVSLLQRSRIPTGRPPPCGSRLSSCTGNRTDAWRPGAGAGTERFRRRGTGCRGTGCRVGVAGRFPGGDRRRQARLPW